MLYRFALLVPFTTSLLVLWASLGLAAPKPEKSLEKCQDTVSKAAQQYVAKRTDAVGDCLNTLSEEIIKQNDPAAVVMAAKKCVNKFGTLDALAIDLDDTITAACEPGQSKVDHTVGDILGDLPGVAEPISALNLDASCAGFGGDGSIDSLAEWSACVAAAGACASDTTIAAAYPRALEWFDAVRPEMVPLDSNGAVAALDVVNAAIEGAIDDDVPELTCGTMCGDGIVDAGEDCDVGMLGAATCGTQGFAGGRLSCGPGCLFETSGCYASRFEDRGLTVYDNQTGREWEKKTDDGSIHDKDNIYTRTTAYTEFLRTLNNCESANGATVSGGFDDHCDWRLPGIDELRTIVDCNLGFPCIDPVFGPTVGPGASGYRSSTPYASNASFVWFVSFSSGGVGSDPKAVLRVRAVRGGLD